MSVTPIAITLNGDGYTVAPGTTILQLLQQLGLDPSRVAVECNREILRQPAWAATEIPAGGRLEVVTFVGGG